MGRSWRPGGGAAITSEVIADTWRVIVREATSGDCEAIAQVLAVVAEEGSIGTEPPVDAPARAKLFWEQLEDPGPGGMWVLDDAGRVVG